MFETSTIQMALDGLIIVLCAVIILIDLYLTLGWISPDLSIRIEQKIRKSLLNKQPIIILDPWYISCVLSHVLILG
jgi:hypothetical protein